MGTVTSATLRNFLMSRRARISPAVVGLRSDGRRRVSGLRREEVAELAQVSVEYYVQIERGRLSGISGEVLDRIANALMLTELERHHFANLVRNLRGTQSRQQDPVECEVKHDVRVLVSLIQDAAVIVMTHRAEVVACNSLARALFEPMFSRGDAKPNFARFVFLDERARSFIVDSEVAARGFAALLLISLGRYPHDARLLDLIDRLKDASAVFQELWNEHDVDSGSRVATRFRHPRVGEIDLRFEALEIPDSSSLTILSYFAAPRDDSYNEFQKLRDGPSVQPRVARRDTDPNVRELSLVKPAGHPSCPRMLLGG